MGKESLVQIIGDRAVIKAKVLQNATELEMRAALIKTGSENKPSVKLIHGPLGSIKHGIATMPIPEELKNGEDDRFVMILGVGEVLPE